MKRFRLSSVVVIALACIVGGGEARSEVWTGTATMVRARHFWTGWADTSHHSYRLAVWHPGTGDQFRGTRVIVRRQSHADPSDILIEDTHVAREALAIESLQSGFTLVFQATLPQTGRWQIRIAASEPARARVAIVDGLVVVASDAVLTGQLNHLADGTQIAGGDRSGFVGGFWGWDGTGFARLSHPYDSIPSI